VLFTGGLTPRRSPQFWTKVLHPNSDPLYNGCIMFANFFDEIGWRGVSAIIGLVLGGVITWLYTRWKRMRARQSILAGDARDTVAIQHHLLEMDGNALVLRIRSRGQEELSRVIPNGHLADELLRRAWLVTPRNTLISMEGPEGSYMLETLTNFVCDRVGNSPFDHDLYVMAPCCEPSELAQHQPITILLISANDLRTFENWPVCRDILVEHGSDGSRVLTLMELARRFKHEQETLVQLRKEGKRTRFVETMYVLDLALDKRTAPVPTKRIPWGRFENVLKQLNLEA